MGTSGYYVIKHKGLYYVFYNHSDSYELDTMVLKDLKRYSSKDFSKMRYNLYNMRSYDDYKEVCEGAGNPKQSNHFEGLLIATEHPEKYNLEVIVEEETFENNWDGYIVVVDFDKNCVKWCGEVIYEGFDTSAVANIDTKIVPGSIVHFGVGTDYNRSAVVLKDGRFLEVNWPNQEVGEKNFFASGDAWSFSFMGEGATLADGIAKGAITVEESCKED